MGISDDIRPKRVRHPYMDPKFFMDETEAPEQTIDKEEEKPVRDASEEITSRERLERQFFDDLPESVVPKTSTPQHSASNLNGNKLKKLFWIALFILAVSIAAYQNAAPLQKKNANSTLTKSSNQTKDYYTGEVATQDQENTPTQTEPIQESAESQVVQEESAPTPTLATIDKTTIIMKVLNGNGISGSAEKVKKQLVDAGFTVSSVTNARKFSYSQTYVYHRTGKEAEAALVKEALTDRNVVIELSDEVVGSNDIIVVVGKS